MAKNKQSSKKVKVDVEISDPDVEIAKRRAAEEPELFDAKCKVCKAEFEEVDLRKNGCPACGHAGLVAN